MLTLTAAVVIGADDTQLFDESQFNVADLGQAETIAACELAKYRPNHYHDEDPYSSAHLEFRIGETFESGKPFMVATPWQDEDIDGNEEFGWSIAWPFDSATVATR